MSTGDARAQAEETPDPDRTSAAAGTGRHMLVYTLGVFLERGIGFIMLPVYTNFLSPADYGVMALITTTLDVIVILAGAKLSEGIFRYYHSARTDAERQRLVSTATITVTSSYLVVAVAVFFSADQISALIFETERYGWIVRIASGGILAGALNVLPVTLMRVLDYSGFYVLTSGVRLLVAVTLNVVFLAGFGWGVEAIFTSHLIAHGLVGIWLSGWLIRRVGFALDGSAIRRLLRYGLPIVGMQFASFTYTFADRFFLQRGEGEAVVGLYDLAYRFGFLLAMVANGPFETVWAPKRFAVIKEPDHQDTLARAFVYQNVILLVCFVGMSVFVGDVLRIMTTPEFHSAAALAPAIMFAYVLQSWSGNQDLGILVSERTEYLLLANWIAAGVSIIGYATLIPLFGAMGAAHATVLAFFARWSTTYFFSQRLWRVQYRWGAVLRMLVAALALIVVSELLPHMRLPVSVAVHGAMVLLFVAGVWLRILDRDERAWVVSSARKLAAGLRR